MRKRILELMPVLACLTLVLATAGAAHATFPGRNGLIAFQAQATADAHIQIYTVRQNGHDLRQITHVSGDATRPDWSPDGRQIVFEIDRDETPFCSIALMNRDGSNIVELTPNEFVCEQDPSFTPNGSRIVFNRFDGVDEAFWSMDLTGNDRQRIGNCCADPNVSPDGRWIVFRLEDHGLSALYKMHPDGSHLRVILPLSSFKPRVIDWGAKPSEAQESEAEE